jgi:membrane protease YdiL (CAAX protease family)
MEYRSIKGFTGVAQLGFLFVFVGLGFIMAGAAQIFIGFKMVAAGTSWENLPDAMMAAMKDPKNVFYSRLAQVMGTFFLLFVPAILFSWLVHGKNKFWLGFNPYINIYQVLIGFLVIFTANILASPLEELSKAVISHMPSWDAWARKLESTYNDQVMVLSNLTSWPEFIMALFIMAFFPALFEEMFFRGVVQNLLVKWWKAPLIAIIVTSLLFSLIHGSLYLFLSRAVLGFVLGMLYYKTKNLWVNVIAHFLNNALALAQLFSAGLINKKMDPANMDLKVEWWVGIVAVMILFFLFKFLDRYSIKNILKINTREQLLLAEANSNPFANTETNQLGNQ